MGGTWALHDARSRFGQLVERAVEDGPQTVTRRGVDTVVVLSIEDSRRLGRKRPSFKAYLKAAPIESLDLERDRDTGRDLAL
jgi:prevent-host-death family protein